MTKHRSKLKIISKILYTCITPTLETPLLQACNLNYDMKNRYKTILLENELLTEIVTISQNTNRETKLKTTEKGLRLLSLLAQVQNILGASI